MGFILGPITNRAWTRPINRSTTFAEHNIWQRLFLRLFFFGNLAHPNIYYGKEKCLDAKKKRKNKIKQNEATI